MYPIVRDRIGWSVCLSVGLSIGQSVMIVSPAKMAEPIKIPFGLWTRMGPRKHALDGSPDPPIGRKILRGKQRLTVKYRDAVP